MTRSLTPADAAAKLGVSVDTLRRWERDGLIESNRTVGGHRRYDEAEILSLVNSPPPPREKRAEPHRSPWPPCETIEENQSLVRHPSPTVPTWEQRVREEEADLEVTKLRHERAVLERAENAEHEALEREALERQRLSAERERERKRIAESESAERARLDKLRAYGRYQAIFAPPEWQAKVARDLETSVTRDAYPVALSEYLAESQVRARVEAVLQPWKDGVAAERKKAEDKKARDWLLYIGKSYAHSKMSGWDSRDIACAERQIDRELKEEVEADWSGDDVRGLVDEILEEWEE
ncbi:MAG: MerR family DNA-binding transcriptional regulator [Gemmatimonadota bacterium]|nr:MerR family DNA-binding transcriptional regulator [Gemmatimonadota bacterium]